MPPPIFVIEANQRSRDYWIDLWRYRDLMFQLTRKDLLVRYRQTLMGIGWSLDQSSATICAKSAATVRLTDLDNSVRKS